MRADVLEQGYNTTWGQNGEQQYGEKMTGKEANSVFKMYSKNYSKRVKNNRKCKATEEVTQEGRQ